ncbi:MAG: YhgN family NAAT transporter [Gammaproteobacteria bacterium]|nr:YhgN family NAAT transporter [Gammaproteobacteria bacterium]
MELYSAAIMLFLIMDPLGNIPLFLSTLKHLPPRRRRIVILRELVIAYGFMLLFLFFGQRMLDALQLSQQAISIAGSIILFLIALKMIFPPEAHEKGEEGPESEPFIVPLAIPLVAGPSLLATLLLLVSKEPTRIWEWLGATTVAWVASAAILLSSSILHKLLRERGLIALERLMGMILVTMSVQMFLNGLGEYLGR